MPATIRKIKPKKEQKEVEAVEPEVSVRVSVEDIDAVLDEIDAVLEENAEEFVRNYVQKGGE